MPYAVAVLRNISAGKVIVPDEEYSECEKRIRNCTGMLLGGLPDYFIDMVPGQSLIPELF
jgi:hypothetical protein